MSALGKYGPGILGAEAFADEQARKATGADKYGPGVLGHLGSAFAEPVAEPEPLHAADHEVKSKRRRHHETPAAPVVPHEA
jgi:hypothetical protein